MIRDIEKLIGRAIPVVKDHPFHSEAAANSRLMAPGKAKAQMEKRGGNEEAVKELIRIYNLSNK